MRYCLTTTSDERFWTDDNPMIFLDQGCIRCSQERRLREKKYIIHKPRWIDPKEFKQSNEYLIDLQDRLRDQLMIELNLLHGVDYDYRSWNILIGWWLKRYLGYLYYKYEMIREICNQYDVYLIGRTEYFFCYMGTTLDSINAQSQSDWYNAIVGERIARWFNIPIEKKVYMPTDDNIIHQAPKKNRKRIESDVVHGITTLLSAGGRCVNYGFLIELSKKDAANGILRKLLCYKCYAIDDTKYAQTEISVTKRRELLRGFAFANDFERMIGCFVCEDIPIAYIEAFRSLKNKAIHYFGDNRSVFYSHNAWFDDEVAKSYLAAKRGEGLKLCGIQHGGTAIHVEDVSSWDVQCVDCYYTWGWKKAIKDCEVRKLPSIKLSNRSRFRIIHHNEPQSDDILYIGTAYPRYTLEFRYKYSVLPGKYVQDQIHLLSCLDQHKLSFRARLYPIDYGWDIVSRIRRTVENCRIEDFRTSFRESYMNSKICIFDVLMTGWCEVYVANKPLIFIVPRHMEYYHQEYLGDIELLRQVGIYHNSVEEAVDYLAGITDDVDAWWREPKRQKNMSQFASKFTYHTEKWKKEWFQELIQNNRKVIK